jgi:hypothetical protein
MAEHRCRLVEYVRGFALSHQKPLGGLPGMRSWWLNEVKVVFFRLTVKLLDDVMAGIATRQRMPK